MLRGDVKDELRKSQMRVSVMKNKEDSKNKRVSTAEIYNNEDYFGSNKSQSLAHQSRQTIPGFSPFE